MQALVVAGSTREDQPSWRKRPPDFPAAALLPGFGPVDDLATGRSREIPTLRGPAVRG